MEIRLDIIAPSPNPIRTTWDEGKMEELTQSIREQGVIQPIKVRENGQGYEIVYGHRRVEAAKRAGLTTIPAVIEQLDDDNALIQALIENFQNEDMTPLDKAHGLQDLKQRTGWSDAEMARRGIMGRAEIGRYLTLLEEPEEILQMVGDRSDHMVSKDTVHEVRRTGLPTQERIEIIKKAATENLSRQQTRQVAEAVAAAPSPKAKERLIERPYASFMHNPEFVKDRAKEYGAHDPLWMERNPKQADADFQQSPEVASIIDMMRRWLKSLADFRVAGQAGKMSPEAGRFIARRVREFANELTAWADELEITE